MKRFNINDIKKKFRTCLFVFMVEKYLKKKLEFFVLLDYFDMLMLKINF